MMRYFAKSWPPPYYIRKFTRLFLDFRRRFALKIEIVDGNYSYHFVCETVREFNRSLKIFYKEPGTVKWINSELKPGQIFYDIGANIGTYSLLAARKVRPHGKVYSFEPHAANFARLMVNLRENRLQGIVIPCSTALDAENGFFNFNYDSLDSGTSDSQLSIGESDDMDSRKAEISELKLATTIDKLIEVRRIEPAHHVKIDVDGNELRILQGMANLLESNEGPLTIQVEMNLAIAEDIQAFMKARNYNLVQTHYSTFATKRAQASKNVLDAGGGNGIFKRSH